jgi:hypothetical protein
MEPERPTAPLEELQASERNKVKIKKKVKLSLYLSI